MTRTIEAELDRYVAATSDDIRTWSRGSIRRRMRAEERREDWRQTDGTLWDQRIFGPVNDFECACGRFKGREASGSICPACRVKVVSKDARRIRFAHVNFLIEFPHPFIADAAPLDAVPIVPAYYWETVYGAPLAKAYEEVVHCSLMEPTPEDVSGVYGVVIANLEKLYEETPDYSKERLEQLARGMALKVRELEIEEEIHEPTIEAADDDSDDDWGELKLADE